MHACMHAIRYNTIQYSTIQYNTVQYNTIQYTYKYRCTCKYKGKCKYNTIHPSIHTYIYIYIIIYIYTYVQPSCTLDLARGRGPWPWLWPVARARQLVFLWRSHDDVVLRGRKLGPLVPFGRDPALQGDTLEITISPVRCGIWLIYIFISGYSKPSFFWVV